MSADAIFEALGDPTRREVVQRLADAGPATATELARAIPVTRQAIAKHLTALASAGLVTSERAGRETRYALTPAPLTDAVDWMAGVGAQWDTRLAALSRFVADGERRKGRRQAGF